MNGHRKSLTDEERLLREEKLREHARDYTDPIKHFVRRQAWIPAAQCRLQKAQAARGVEHLRYFTLCAEKAIDVHLFYFRENLIDHDGRRYPQVVFCECYPDQFELIATRLSGTRGFLARFEDLVLDRNCEVSKDFYSELPFDIYNLDFTAACFPRGDPPFSDTLNAIVTLVEALAEEEPRPQGFEMFLTFRARRSEENEEAIRDLRANVRENMQQFQWFHEAFERSYGPSVGELVNDGYHEFLLVALPKLLGQFAKDSGFRVECPYRLYYPRPDPQRPEFYIISFVLSLDWVGVSTTSRRSVRQPAPTQAITTVAYVEMVRHVVEHTPINVGTARFPRGEYEQEVQELLSLVEDL